MAGMTESAEAWFRKPRKIIHNQTIIQTLLTLAFLIPMPIAAGAMWLIANSPAIVIQTVLFTWSTATAAYLTLIAYIRVRTRDN